MPRRDLTGQIARYGDPRGKPRKVGGKDERRARPNKGAATLDQVRAMQGQRPAKSTEGRRAFNNREGIAARQVAAEERRMRERRRKKGQKAKGYTDAEAAKRFHDLLFLDE